MSSKRYTQEQILKVLKEIDSGSSIASVGRSYGVNVQTIAQWRKRYAGMSQGDLAQLKLLEEENRRLKRIVANQAMDIEAYKELQRGKW